MEEASLSQLCSLSKIVHRGERKLCFLVAGSVFGLVSRSSGFVSEKKRLLQFFFAGFRDGWSFMSWCEVLGVWVVFLVSNPLGGVILPPNLLYLQYNCWRWIFGGCNWGSGGFWWRVFCFVWWCVKSEKMTENGVPGVTPLWVGGSGAPALNLEMMEVVVVKRRVGHDVVIGWHVGILTFLRDAWQFSEGLRPIPFSPFVFGFFGLCMWACLLGIWA